jgi:hypothetical protein
MVTLRLNLTKQQAEGVIDALCSLKYDEATGQQYREVSEWMYVLRYNASDADGLDKLIGSTLLSDRFANASIS